MRTLTYGPIVKNRVKTFLKELLYCAVGEKQNEKIEIKWENENSLKPTLLVEGKSQVLGENAGFKYDKKHYFTETIKHLESLGILEDRRMNKQGSEKWYFALKLWSRDTDKNLKQFDQEWENRRLKGNDQEIVNPTPRPIIFELVLMDFDIEREPQESECLTTIRQPGSFLRIKGPQYMGKTRLLNRVLAKIQKARRDHCHIVVLNWQNDFDSTVFNNYDRFLENFCATVSRYLGLPDNLDKYWNQRGTPNSKTTNYFCNYLLPQIEKIESQLILVLEEMDQVFQYPLTTKNFCGLLRGWHGYSKRDKLWQKFNLVIVHSTDPYATFDIQTSPLWNLGETITLEEFTYAQVGDLVKKYGLSLTHEQVAQLMEMSNGHPFLVNHAFKTIAKQSLKLEEILAKAATQESIYHNHLLELWTILKDNPLLKEAFKRLVTESPRVPLEPDILFKLESLGLVKVNGNYASPRCQLYHQYFANRLVEKKRTS